MINFDLTFSSSGIISPNFIDIMIHDVPELRSDSVFYLHAQSP